MKDGIRIIAVIPAYNEAATIVPLVEAVKQEVDQVIVVDDGSTDKTAELLLNSDINLLCNEWNLGKGGSLQKGFDAALIADADMVVTLDGDGQHLPSDIPMLIEAAKKNQSSIIIAARMLDRQQAPMIRRFANGFADFWISWAAGYPIRDTQSGFRLYPAELLKIIDINSNPERGFVYESELLINASRQGVFSISMPIASIYRPEARKSHYQPARDTWRIVRMVAGKLFKKGMYPLGLLRALHVIQKPR